MNQKISVLVAAAVVAVVSAQALGQFGGGSPLILTPSPIPFVVPILILNLPVVLAISLFTLAFLIWRPALFHGAVGVPIRTLALFAITSVLSFVWFISSWSYGLKYEGRTYTVVCALLSAALFSVSGFLLWRARTAPSFVTALLSQTTIFLWLASYALPYLGETP